MNIMISQYCQRIFWHTHCSQKIFQKNCIHIVFHHCEYTRLFKAFLSKNFSPHMLHSWYLLAVWMQRCPFSIFFIPPRENIFSHMLQSKYSIAISVWRCTLWKKVVLERLTFYLNSSNLFPNEQYGFWKWHSTVRSNFILWIESPKLSES